MNNEVVQTGTASSIVSRSTIRETETEDQSDVKRQSVLATDQHGTDVDADMCKTIVLAAGPEDRDGRSQQVVDWSKKRSESGHLGHLCESQKVSESRIMELANAEKLEVAEMTLQEARAQGSEIVHVGWLDDAARGTPEDPDAVRSRMDATQVNTYDREDVVQATLPIKASSIMLSSAATKPNAKDQHWSSCLGLRSMQAWYGTVRRGTDFFSSGSAAAPGVVKRVRTAHFNTKIMPHIGPMVFGGEMIERHHSYRRTTRSPRKSEWESDSKHVDMTELSRRKLDSKRTPTPVTKATGKGR